jgi:hypothetical protein
MRGSVNSFLEADAGLAAETAVAKLFEHGARSIQFNRAGNASSDRAVREHARNLAAVASRASLSKCRSAGRYGN